MTEHAVEAKLAAMGLSLPPACPPRASFAPFRLWNGLLVLSGENDANQLPRVVEGVEDCVAEPDAIATRAA